MAVLADWPGLEAEVIVDGKPLREYDNRSSVPSKTVERYVEAQTGATFEIRFRFAHPFPRDRPVSMIVSIDGRALDEPLVPPHELYQIKGHVSAGSISNVGAEFLVQKFRFSALDIEEGNFETVPDEVKQLLEPVGTITLNFYFLENPRRNTELEWDVKDVEGVGTVSEKAVKGAEALSHSVSLAQPEATADVDYFDAEYADEDPFATFRFHYRSLKALKDVHIIPRTPEPVDLVETDEHEILAASPEQLRRMVAHWKRQEEIRLRLKRERRSESVTVVGDDEVLGDAGDEVQIVSARRKKKKQKRAERSLPGEGDVIIELD